VNLQTSNDRYKKNVDSDSANNSSSSSCRCCKKSNFPPSRQQTWLWSTRWTTDVRPVDFVGPKVGIASANQRIKAPAAVLRFASGRQVIRWPATARGSSYEPEA
jgi:hypothetical protein